MLAALIVVSVLALALLAAVSYLTARSLTKSAPPLVASTLVVNTKDDRTIRGVLHGQYSDRWTLRDASLVLPQGEQALGGLQHILVSNISFAQEILPGKPAAGDS